MDDGFPGEFIEVPLEPWAVYVGDYVTIACRHEGRRFVADRIVVVDLPGAAMPLEKGPAR